MPRKPSSPRHSAVGRVAGLARSRNQDDPELIAARQELKVLTLEDHINRIVDSWPPLTPAQRTRVAVLLTSAGA